MNISVYYIGDFYCETLEEKCKRQKKYYNEKIREMRKRIDYLEYKIKHLEVDN